MRNFDDLARKKKALAAIEIVVRAALFVFFLLPFLAYFLFVSPDFLMGVLSILMTAIIGFPFGLLGSWVWKWQIPVAVMMVIIFFAALYFHGPTLGY